MAQLIPLKQSTAATLLIGPFLDETDGKTAETALTISQADVLLWKQGGTTMAQKNETTSATHRSIGYYTVPIDSTDTNTLGVLSVAVHEAGALPVRQDYAVLPALVWDEMFDASYSTALRGLVAYGTAQAATGTTIQLAAATSMADDVVNGCVVGAYGSTQGYWQYRIITDYVNSTDTATVDTWTVTPSGTVTYVVFGAPPADATNVTPVNVTKWSGTTVASPDTAGYPKVTHKSGTGAGELNITSGVVDANATKLSGTALTGRDIGASVLLSSGTGTGQLDFTSGVVKANLAQILGTALTETAGQIANAFKQFFNIASPTSTMNTITAVTTTATATNVTTVNGLANNTITAASINAAAITSAKFATDAIDANAIKADAVTEIQSGLATASALSTAAGEVTAIKAKTDSLTFTTAGQVDANVQSINDVALVGDGSATKFHV